MYGNAGNGSKRPVTGSVMRGTGKVRSLRDWKRLLLPVVGFLWIILCSDWRFRNGSRKGKERGRLYVSLLACRAPIRGGF